MRRSDDSHDKVDLIVIDEFRLEAPGADAVRSMRV
jgi:hypothetical protein